MRSTRRLVYDLMQRSKEDHATIAASFCWDITDTMARLALLESQGRRISLTAYLLRATAMVMVAHPAMNRRVFHRWGRPYLVQWDEVSCNVIVARCVEGSDEEVVFTKVVRALDACSVDEIQGILDGLQTSREELQADMARNKRALSLPRPILALANQLFRFSPSFLVERFGTYNFSSLMTDDSSVTGLVPISPTTTFYPMSVGERPLVIDGEVKPRMTIAFCVATDHHCVDGKAASRAILYLKQLVQDPDLVLGPLDGGLAAESP